MMSDKTIKEINKAVAGLICKRNYEEAIKLLEKELKENEDKELMINLAKAYFYVEKSSQAQKILEKVLEKDKNNHLAMYLLARVKYHLMDKKEEAVNLALKAIKLNSENSFYYSLAALIFSALKNTKRAIKLANESLELDKNNYEAHLVLAVNFDEENTSDQSEKHFALAMKTGAGYDNTYFYLNYIHLELAKTKKGYELIKEAYLENNNFDYYEWLLKFSYMRNQPLNLPFVWLDEFSMSKRSLIVVLVILFSLIGVMYINEGFCIAVMEIFKWACSVVFIIYLPYQIVVYAMLSIYVKFILLPKLTKSLA